MLAGLVPEVTDLPYFGLVEAKLASVPVTVSRTGYTGDLGFELTVPADDAVAVLDAVLEAGRPHGMRPFGEEALMTLRIEAGLPLDRCRVAGQPHRLDRPRPGHAQGARSGLDAQGRARRQPAVHRQRGDPPRAVDGTSRWATTGIVVDWADWDRLHRDAGELPTKDEQSLGWEQWLRATDGPASRSATSTSFCYSPVLQRHIGIARVRPELAAARHRAAHGDDAAPQHAHGRGDHRPAALLQPSSEDGQAMTETSPTTGTQLAAPRRRTTPSWSAAATTA